MTIPSPCVDVCRLDGATGFCIGCLRTRDEIREWKTMTDDLRVQVIAQKTHREVTAKAQIHGPRAAAQTS
ncbi:DUF1289 domain-containing protein [Paraburkholderia bryophila]|uniref:Fe-S protein YdhL (DUF1289 family) n=1 Tax=Paraburkholderia bryophila TaxID=420952 RepID=A0A7Z0B1X5_9BURK|nr:DUF1289 domain-containing protein [Paraburkholderia bryophila]NYH16837.1 hypothetical protein [Paraburkholderia bryophila]NYH27848.1 hypothetical protein [Paraburkholderia bryophila]